MGGPGFVFGMSFLVGYRHWARGSGLWAVRVAKKSARAISSVDFSSNSLTPLAVLLILVLLAIRGVRSQLFWTPAPVLTNQTPDPAPGQ